MIRGVTALLFALLLFAPQEKRELCAVSGTVVDSLTGAPLSKAQVVLEPAYGKESATTASNEKGRFMLVGVAPGTYLLKGVRNGYLDTYYGARRPRSQGVKLTLVAGDESKGLELKLLPYAVIGGVVRDSDGEPLAGARVALIGIAWVEGVRVVNAVGQYANTDDQGRYRIPYVKPGSYYVRAAPKVTNEWRVMVDHSPKDAPPPEGLVATWHPGSRELAGARRLDVATGDRVTDADVTLLRSRMFRVRVRTASPEGFDFDVRMQERPHFSDALVGISRSECKDGLCDFTGVPSGAWLISGMASPPNRTLADMFTAKALRASLAVDVVNADIDGLRLVVETGGEIVGRVVVEGEEHPKIPLHVVFVDGTGEETRAIVADESFTALLSPGKYAVRVSVKDLVVERVRSENVDVLEEGLRVRPGKVPLEVVLSHNAASLDGIAQDGDGKPVAGATVVLVPESSRRSRADLLRDVHTDQHGRYEITAVPPGEYKLFAWNDVEPGIWFDPEFMKGVEAKGQEVKLSAKGHESETLTVLDPM